MSPPADPPYQNREGLVTLMVRFVLTYNSTVKRKTRQAFEQINFLEHNVFILLSNHVTWAPSVVEGKEAIKLIPGLASCFSHGPLEGAKGGLHTRGFPAKAPAS